ncbi:hypothetical protein HF086_013343 [Spodoptera exigua]|uniref:PH domain-containing protein n=1 Tax=Spodoptera exigua TaxID=7107 RepID=A0A922M314_SPOEX|nr:hypothetical protein HF086_013343 [Spodoptera exigua]
MSNILIYVVPSYPEPQLTKYFVYTGFADDLVTRRQKKDAQLGEEERAMRRVSYLKATWGDRLHLDSDVEPENDPQGLRGTTKKGEEEIAENAVEATEGDVQGNVQIKMVVSNGKRASDRSWKQVWAVLHGTKLYLYRHHPSQVGHIYKLQLLFISYLRPAIVIFQIKHYFT